jgi:hypothetical protein
VLHDELENVPEYVPHIERLPYALNVPLSCPVVDVSTEAVRCAV